jgi:hypothetical protein
VPRLTPDSRCVASTLGSHSRRLGNVQWAVIAPLLPSNEGRCGHPFGDDSRVVDGLIYRSRTSTQWRDVPRYEFGSWQLLLDRPQARTNHFMPLALFDSLLAALGEVEDHEAGFGVTVDRGVGELVREIGQRMPTAGP